VTGVGAPADLPLRTMATRNTATTDEKVTNTLADSIGLVLGIDGSGDAHVYYPTAERVAVYETGADYEIGDKITGEPAVEQDLTGRSLSAWMTYTQQERGIWTRTTRHAEGQHD
jgi:hypothetical protein